MMKKILTGICVLCLSLSMIILPQRIIADSNSSASDGFSTFVNNSYNSVAGNTSVFTSHMSSRVQSVSNFGSGLNSAASIYNNVSNLANNGLTGHNQGQQLIQALTITADLTMGMVGLAMTLGGVAAGPAFIAAAMAIGIINAYFWSDEGIAMMDAIDNWFKPSEDANVYKPNIYIYTSEPTEVSLTFAYQDLVTVSIPEYRNGWQGLAHQGIIEVDNVNYDYLFYEAKTDTSLYQYQQAFMIPAQQRSETFYRILKGYNFTEKEINDFIQFWDDMLADEDFLMYPQLTETIDTTMPLSANVDFNEYFRVWFAFAQFNGQSYKPAAVKYFNRTNTSTLLEWGGFIVEVK